MDADLGAAEGGLKMAKLYIKKSGDTIVGYAYGDEWVAQALFMDD